jgi:hypothetical protein
MIDLGLRAAIPSGLAFAWLKPERFSYRSPGYMLRTWLLLFDDGYYWLKTPWSLTRTRKHVIDVMLENFRSG